MEFNNSNYVVNISSIKTPNISINLNTDTVESVQNKTVSYTNDVNNYVLQVKNAIGFKTYVNGRLEKDVCAKVGLAKINRTTNEYIANVKADNYFNEAKGNLNINILSGINNIVSAIERLVKTFFNLTDEAIQDESWNVNVNLPAVIYDDKAISTNISNVVSDKTENIIFINDVANAVDLNRTFTSYITIESVEAKEYTIKYNTELSTWILVDANDNNSIIATINGMDSDNLVFMAYSDAE